MIFASEKQQQRLKWAFESCKNGAWGNEPEGDGDVVCVRAADFDGQSGRLNNGERTLRAIEPAVFDKIALRPGDLVMEKSGGGEKQLVGRTVLFDDDRPSMCSNFLARCRPAEGIDPAWLNYLMLAIYAARGTWPHIKQSTGIQNLDLGSYLNTRVSIPALPVQQRIARFLDQKTARIDALIEKKQALLKRLAEKRQALITRAVTKGLNPDVPMKPSGMEWLGKIPAHWMAKRLSFTSDVIDCKHRTPDYIDDGIALVSTSEIKPYLIEYGTKRRVSEEEFQAMSEGGRQPVPGDIIYSRNASVGSAAMVRSTEKICLGQDLCLIRPRELHSAYLEYFQNSEIGFEQLQQVLIGATFKRVNVDSVKKYFVLVPPLDEQAEIVNFLDQRLRSENASHEKVAESIDAFHTYRSALITAAVTGQLAELNG